MNIGIDLGGSHIGIGLVDENGNVIEKFERDINKEDIVNIEKVIEITIIESINKILENYNININEIQKIGIASPGEPKEGCIRNVVNLSILSFPIVKILKSKLNYESISIRNDAKCAAIAEKVYGSLEDIKDAVFLCIGTGIGGAAFIDGKLLIPKRNSGFEFGHMIIKKDGKVCKCGNRGCFEAYGSMKNFKLNIAEQLKIDGRDSRKLLEKLKQSIKQEEINNIIEEYLEDLVVGLSNITNILEPEVITIGGGFVYYKEILWDRLNEKFTNSGLLFNKGKGPKLKLATLGNDAGIIGAGIDRIKK